jgi:hypothetical protein
MLALSPDLSFPFVAFVAFCSKLFFGLLRSITKGLEQKKAKGSKKKA